MISNEIEEPQQNWQPVEPDVDLIDPMADDGREVQTMYSGTGFMVFFNGQGEFFQLPDGYAICKWSDAA